jgi:hypothetical protein
MKQSFLRVKMRVKREVMRATGFNPNQIVSIERKERTPSIQHEKIKCYSTPTLLEIFDPRSQKMRGHYFQERNAYLVKDVILEPKQGLVFSKHGELVEESTSWPPSFLYNSFPWNPQRLISRLHVSTAIFLPGTAFGHWLMEDLPLFITALQLSPSAPILIPKSHPKFIADLVKSLDREVIYLNGPVRVDSLILIQKNLDSGWPHPKDIEVLNHFPAFVEAKSKNAPSSRVYASRRGSKRSPENESQIEKLFEEFGFKVFQLEKLNLLEEISLLSSTSVLAGFHGSAHTNVVWMPSGGSVLDIVNENYWTEAGHRLAFLRNCSYDFQIYKGNMNKDVSLSEIRDYLTKNYS